MIKMIGKNELEMTPLEAIKLAQLLLENAAKSMGNPSGISFHPFTLPSVDMDKDCNVFPSKFIFKVAEE